MGISKLSTSLNALLPPSQGDAYPRWSAQCGKHSSCHLHSQWCSWWGLSQWCPHAHNRLRAICQNTAGAKAPSRHLTSTAAHDLHSSSELPSCCLPTITSGGDHTRPILRPPDMHASFDFTKHCQQWSLTPEKPFNSCLHPLTKGSVPGPNKNPIPVSASQEPWDGHKIQQSPLGTTSTCRVTFSFTKILMVVAAPCLFQKGNLG